jgi:hypothetical protein
VFTDLASSCDCDGFFWNDSFGDDGSKEGLGVDAPVRQALVQLLASWPSWVDERSWYLKNFLPRVINDFGKAARDPHERELLGTLHGLLADDDWEALGLLLVQVYRDSEAEVRRLRLLREEQRKRDLARWRQDAEARKRAAAAEVRAARLAEEATRTEARRKAEARQAAEFAARRDATKREAEERAARAQIERDKARVREDLRTRLHTELRRQFLHARDWLRTNDPEGLISPAEFHAAAAGHVTDWCSRNLTRPDGAAFVPDAEQAHAIATVGTHALVAARAGSGKTVTMVARVVFLVRACGVDPKSIQRFGRRRNAGELGETVARGTGPSRDDVSRSRLSARPSRGESALRSL